MIIQIEIKGPLRIKPKRELASYGWRVIWLWFSVAYYPHIGINEMARTFMEAGKKELIDAGWKDAETVRANLDAVTTEWQKIGARAEKNNLSANTGPR